MRTLFVNEIWNGDKEVVRGFIVVEKTIIENLKLLFNEAQQQYLKNLITTEPTKSGGFHTFTRFCQFVVSLEFNPVLGLSIEVMYFGTSDNVNDTFDYTLKLKKTGWNEDDRDKILEIAYNIKKDMYEPHFEFAELKIKDHYASMHLYG